MKALVSSYLPLLLGACALVASAHSEPAGKIPRENIEWCDVWMTHGNDNKLPRVLLIGDSITRGYFPAVEKKLGGKAYCDRICTSRSVGDPALIEEIALFASREKYAVIHFNNGMHGWGITEEAYGAAFPKFVEAIRKAAPDAKLIWTTTTPVRDDEKRTARIRERNRLALECVSKLGIPVDDQFALTEPHPDWHGKDPVHFNGTGAEAQGDQVAQEIEKLLPQISASK